MQRAERAQEKWKNQGITPADKGNMWKTKNKYRYAKK